MTVVRVLPNVSGLDKTFDYLAPDESGAQIGVQLGDLVRVDLHGRPIGGWVIAIDPPNRPVGDDQLKAIRKITGRGPSADIIALADWAGDRWGARQRPFLVTASPRTAVPAVSRPRYTGSVVEPRSPASTKILTSGGGVLRLPPTSDPLPAVLSAVALGPTLVVVPAVDMAMMFAARLRRSGLSVALAPDDWAAAAGGVDVVIGSRTAAWATCPSLSSMVLIDEQDEALQDESSPTWHARDVLIERATRLGVPLLIVSPAPTVTALEWGSLTRPPRERERDGWPIVDVVDRRDEDPWKRSLVTSELIRHLRDPDRIVVCISNTTGRARLLACRNCRTLARCEHCGAAVSMSDDQHLVCHSCGTERPPVCLECSASRFANLRPGVTRLREELEAAANRPAVLITGASETDAMLRGAAPGVYVGTEAALHRVPKAGTVAFLDFDRELLAPRFRAAEQAMALVVRAARMVGRREFGGRILLQTFLPDHDVVQAALHADPTRLAEPETERRRLLDLPPFGAYAEISGKGSDEFIASIADDIMLTVARIGPEEWVARSDDWLILGHALRHATRPPGSRLRVAVDPAR